MLRLLQGDVGSGKTIGAIAACLQTISQQKQACVISPTTVLAKQHLAYFRKLLDKLEIRTEILTSATTKKQKAKILEDLNQHSLLIINTEIKLNIPTVEVFLEKYSNIADRSLQSKIL